jgi:hypothetical protein
VNKETGLIIHRTLRWYLLYLTEGLLFKKNIVMEFEKYQHVERLGTVETEGIEYGTCYVFPKIDGTNSQLWFNEAIQAGSRNRQLSLDNDNAGFYNWAVKQICFYKLFEKYPTIRLYGEWLVPHSLRTYNKDSWNNFYVFDVTNGGEYLTYETYKSILEEFGIEYIPPICKVDNPIYERLQNQLEKNGYLIEDGKGIGEGIVIKNYNFKNKFGRITWAKIVTNEFKAKHSKTQITELKECNIIEQDIVNKYVTLSLIDKEFSKIQNESGCSSKMIPRLLNVIYYCLVTEECWNFVKEFKNPTINFKTLFFLTTVKIKQTKPELF